MLKVMIVDDEYHIRHGISQSVPWSELGMMMVGEAEGGEEAYRKFKSLSPDIMLLDINIPGFNGLELGHRIRKDQSDTELIFLTGYDDFEKLKEALTMQAADYLLKPVSYGDLMEALRKTQQRLVERRSKHHYVVQLESKVSHYSKVASEQLLLDLLQQRRTLKELLQELSQIGIHFDFGGIYGAMSIEMDHFNQRINRMNERDRGLYLYAFRKLAQEVLDANSGGLTITESPSKLTLLARYTLDSPCMRNEEELSKAESFFINMAKKLQSVYEQYVKMSVTIGVSRGAYLTNLHEAYDEAWQAIKYKALIGTGQVIPFQFVRSSQHRGSKLLGKELFLLSELRAGCDSNVAAILNEWLQELQEMPFQEAKLAASQFIVFVMRLMEEAEVRDQELRQHDPLVHLTNSETLAGLLSHASQYITAVGKAVKMTKETPSIKIIEQAKLWIRQQMAEDISLSKLASHLHMSPNYLSQLFKQASGETFIEFTIRVRFERAKELLSDPSLKVHEVAQMIGFSDPNYFSIAFKKHQGLTPTEYRQRFGSILPPATFS